MLYNNQLRPLMITRFALISPLQFLMLWVEPHFVKPTISSHQPSIKPLTEDFANGFLYEVLERTCDNSQNGENCEASLADIV